MVALVSFSLLRGGLLLVSGGRAATTPAKVDLWLLTALPMVWVEWLLRRGAFPSWRLSVKSPLAWLLTALWLVFAVSFMAGVRKYFGLDLRVFEVGWVLFCTLALWRLVGGGAWTAALAVSLWLAVGGLAFVELALRLMPQPQHRLPDYPQLYTVELAPAGHLKPSQNLQAAGERGPVRWVTNAAGFRNEREFSAAPTSDTLRILYLGDSFVAGYRMDQAEASGALIERMLQAQCDRAGQKVRVEVMIACLEDPVQAAKWLASQGLGWQPRLVIYGLCIGNDLSQALFNDTEIMKKYYDKMLPKEAYPPDAKRRCWTACARLFTGRRRWGGGCTR